MRTFHPIPFLGGNPPALSAHRPRPRPQHKARNNIAPTEDVLFVTAGEDGNDTLREGRWWLVPWWATEIPKAAMFNARSESRHLGGVQGRFQIDALPDPSRWLL